MANEILKYGLDQCLYQLEQVFAGVEDFDAKPIATQMSPREVLVHLCEVYQAFLTEAAGGKHSWGTYALPGEANDDLKKFTFALRSQAVAVVEANPTEEVEKHAMAFMVLHDPYHVGQMVQHRLAMEPDWNAYSIYPSE